MSKNCRGMYENFKEIDLIRDSHPRDRETWREIENTLNNQLVYFSIIFNIELQLCIYRIPALILLTHMT